MKPTEPVAPPNREIYIGISWLKDKTEWVYNSFALLYAFLITLPIWVIIFIKIFN